MLFSKDLLSKIHIRLDEKGLEELDEKEVSVLSTEQVCDKIDEATLPIHEKLDSINEQIELSTEQVCDKIDKSILPIHGKLDEINGKFDEVSDKLDNLSKTILPIHEELTNFRKTIDRWAKRISALVVSAIGSFIAYIILRFFGIV